MALVEVVDVEQLSFDHETTARDWTRGARSAVWTGVSESW